MNEGTHKTADLWPAHSHQTLCLHLMYLLSTYDVAHVILYTSPSCFSVSNIEKPGMGLGTRLDKHGIALEGKGGRGTAPT